MASMTIGELLEWLNGCGLLITDEQLITETLDESNLKLSTTVAFQESE